MQRNVTKQMGSILHHYCKPLVEILDISHLYHDLYTAKGCFASTGFNLEWHEYLFTHKDCHRSLPDFNPNTMPHCGIVFSQGVKNKYWESINRTGREEFNVNLILQITTKTDDGYEAFGFGIKNAVFNFLTPHLVF